MKIGIFAAALLIHAPMSASAENLPYGMTFLRGNCAQLVFGSEDWSGKCDQKLMQTAVNRNNIDFYFSTTDNRMLIFNGVDGENPTPDTDVSTVKKVIFSQNGTNTDFPASGRCSYGNPYKGRSTVQCSGTLKDGRRFDATFVTDGQPPDTGEPQTGRFIPPIPASPSPSSDDTDVEQGYSEQASGSTFQPAEDSGTFTLKMCNKTKSDINVALYGKYNSNVNDLNYVVTGWLIAPKKACKSFSNLAKGDFAFYATDAAGNQWAGRDRKLCVESNAFQRIHFEKYKCAKALVRGFTDVEITGDEYVLNFSR